MSHNTETQIKEESTLWILDGFWMYAMIWLFVGGTYLFATYFVIANPQDINYFYSKFLFTMIPASFMAIDVFLFISGLINTYNLLKIDELTAK